MSKETYHWQGSLDGLCGYYAIVNALTECGVLSTFRKQQKLFRDLFKEAPEIYRGLNFKTMQALLRGPQRSWPSLSIHAPFADRALKASGDVDTYLGQIFSSKNVICAVIKIRRKCDEWDDHWIVIKRRGKKVQFIDSACEDGKPCKIKKTVLVTNGTIQR